MRGNNTIKQIIEDRLLIHGAYKRLFETPDGKTVLRHILQAGFVTKSTFVKSDPHETALNEGSRRLALSILTYVKKNPQEIVNEVQESVKI